MINGLNINQHLVKEKLTYCVLLIGLFVGAMHFKVGLKAIFVFTNNEPFLVWVFVLLGPLTTLPAVILSFFKPRIGGAWLITGSLLSLLAVVILAIERKELDRILSSFVRYSIPMITIGIILLFKDRIMGKADPE